MRITKMGVTGDGYTFYCLLTTSNGWQAVSKGYSKFQAEFNATLKLEAVCERR